jgi:hypothetical protein
MNVKTYTANLEGRRERQVNRGEMEEQYRPMPVGKSKAASSCGPATRKRATAYTWNRSRLGGVPTPPSILRCQGLCHCTDQQRRLFAKALAPVTRTAPPNGAHEKAVKTSETNATKRAPATFGKLSLYLDVRVPRPEIQRRRTAQKLGPNGRYHVSSRPRPNWK